MIFFPLREDYHQGVMPHGIGKFFPSLFHWCDKMSYYIVRPSYLFPEYFAACNYLLSQSQYLDWRCWREGSSLWPLDECKPSATLLRSLATGASRNSCKWHMTSSWFVHATSVCRCSKGNRQQNWVRDCPKSQVFMLSVFTNVFEAKQMMTLSLFGSIHFK